MGLHFWFGKSDPAPLNVSSLPAMMRKGEEGSWYLGVSVSGCVKDLGGGLGVGDPEIFSFLSVFSTLFLFLPCQHQTRQD